LHVFYFQKCTLAPSNSNNAPFFGNKKARISYVGGAALIKLNVADVIWVIKEFILPSALSNGNSEVSL